MGVLWNSRSEERVSKAFELESELVGVWIKVGSEEKIVCERDEEVG